MEENDQYQRTLDQRGRGRQNRREELDEDDGGDYSRTLKNLGDGLATLQNKRNQQKTRQTGRHQTHEIQFDDEDMNLNERDHIQDSQPRRNAQYRGDRDDSPQDPENVDDHLDMPDERRGHARNPSGGQ